MTEQHYLDLQKFVVLELGMVLLPITSQNEAAGLLVQMVSMVAVCQICSRSMNCSQPT